MIRKDLTLLTIACAKRGPLQPVQLQKSLFLICKNVSAERLGIDRPYVFEPYDFGPFCSDVYRDADRLEAEGLVAITHPPESEFKLYRTTSEGSERAERIRESLASDVVEYVREVVEFTQSLTFNQLVSAVYRSYPEMRVNSVFQE
jgi:hypothetical protein